MIEEKDLESFLYVSKTKYQIFVFNKKELINVYSDELKVDNRLNFYDFSNLPKFLDENIYKIEKKIGNFIKNIVLILKDDQNLHVNISIKKKNYDGSINQKYLVNNLTELKDLYKENYPNENIMHMIIINYIIDGKKYSSFRNNLTSNNLCLEVNFISISNELVFRLSKILEKYQIKIYQFMCGNYIKNFFHDDHNEISLMACKLRNGYNENEAIVIPKNIENKGFFEKFFQLFS
jgi:hypothetical protein